MSILEVLPDSDPFLRKTSKRIRRTDESLIKLVNDMYETMVEKWGVGLAAIQVGVPKRLFIYEIPQRDLKGYEACEKGTNANPETDAQPGQELVLTDQNQISEDLEESKNNGYTGNYTVCINPKIISREGSFIDEEGCLSKPGWVAKVERALRITFEAFDINMKKFTRTVEGMEARCVQHEIDHLDGILFTDRAIPGTLIDTSIEAEDEEKSNEENNVKSSALTSENPSHAVE